MKHNKIHSLLTLICAGFIGCGTPNEEPTSTNNGAPVDMGSSDVSDVEVLPPVELSAVANGYRGTLMVEVRHSITDEILEREVRRQYVAVDVQPADTVELTGILRGAPLYLDAAAEVPDQSASDEVLTGGGRLSIRGGTWTADADQLTIEVEGIDPDRHYGIRFEGTSVEEQFEILDQPAAGVLGGEPFEVTSGFANRYATGALDMWVHGDPAQTGCVSDVNEIDHLFLTANFAETMEQTDAGADSHFVARLRRDGNETDISLPGRMVLEELGADTARLSVAFELYGDYVNGSFEVEMCN